MGRTRARERSERAFEPGCMQRIKHPEGNHRTVTACVAVEQRCNEIDKQPAVQLVVVVYVRAVHVYSAHHGTPGITFVLASLKIQPICIEYAITATTDPIAIMKENKSLLNAEKTNPIPAMPARSMATIAPRLSTVNCNFPDNAEVISTSTETKEMSMPSIMCIASTGVPNIRFIMKPMPKRVVCVCGGNTAKRLSHIPSMN